MKPNVCRLAVPRPLHHETLNKWVQEQGVDASAREVFLSMPVPAQLQVRALGDVNSPNVQNKSALLMSRIREFHSSFVLKRPDFLQERVNRAQRWAGRHREYGGAARLPSVIVFVSGEANRVGERGQHRCEKSFQQFGENMQSYNEHLV